MLAALDSKTKSHWQRKVGADNAPYIFATTFTRLAPAGQGTVGVLLLESDQFPIDRLRVIIAIDGVIVFEL